MKLFFVPGYYYNILNSTDLQRLRPLGSARRGPEDQPASAILLGDLIVLVYIPPISQRFVH